MSKPVIEVRVRAIVAISGGCAIFLGNEEKVFVILVDPGVGGAIIMAIAGTLKERPLTHDLLVSTLQALGARTERVVLNDLKDDTYFARLVLNVENELQHKIVEIDARPSDCIALATRQRAPIYVNIDVWNEVEDMTEELQKLEKKATEESDGGLA
ncbi:MAG TPA: bifunctional nuclease family protein [Chthoniobacterales bacterium]|nr:bifunctional nuclease family protein [Chthoniobacterales bacterium]